MLVYYHDIRWQQRLHIGFAIHVEAFLGDESGPAGEGTGLTRRNPPKNHRNGLGKSTRKSFFFHGKVHSFL